MNTVELLTEKLKHEIDMDILKEIGEQVGADLTKEMEIAEKKFNNRIERVINGMTNKTVHKIDIRISPDGNSLRSSEIPPPLFDRRSPTDFVGSDSPCIMVTSLSSS